MIIYKITNIINNKSYIGQTTKSLKERIKNHLNRLKRNTHINKHLQAAYNLHGKDVFKIEQIDTAITLEELNQKEVYWINHYDSMNPENGYNKTSGGNVCKFSKDTCEKIGNSSRGRVPWNKGIPDPELSQRNKGNTYKLGKKTSESTRILMSKSAIGKIKSNEHCKNISKAKKGIPNLKLKDKPKSQEHARKIGAAQLGKKQSFEHILKRVNKNKGQKRSQETRLKMSIAQQKRRNKETT